MYFTRESLLVFDEGESKASRLELYQLYCRQLRYDEVSGADYQVREERARQRLRLEALN
ncbi:hypothetical protein [Dongshaea marina]|uniref:hypothetical protein n=1 Tax=Dongshaea marina TaxID=2047966 RepID=UPI00131EFA27|nr:hypothetical protein [Dongshaea marina]